MFYSFILESSHLFWTILEVLRILMVKLGSSFWLIPNNVESPVALFALVTRNVSYVDLCEKLSLTGFDPSNVPSKSKESDVNTAYQHTNSALFDWLLPLITSMISLENLYVDTLDQVFLYYIDIFGMGF